MFTNDFSASRFAVAKYAVKGGTWQFSWPLIMGVLVYLYFASLGTSLLRDGDTYWHVAAGQWMLANRVVPTQDPFSHSMPGAAWTAHEWLSEVILAGAYQWGGWYLVIAITSLCIGLSVAILTRALLAYLEPIYALGFSAFAVFLTASHVLARPHVLAMPLMMIWTIELVRASEAARSPRLWLLPVMTLWANLHGGFTLGIALASAFALEAILASKQQQRVRPTAKAWGVFIALSTASALITPHGLQGIQYTWEIFFEHSYALERIGEWQSPDFHAMQPLELWLIGGMAAALSVGLRLPVVRLILVLGVVHLSLKHTRSIELVGLLSPLFVAAPLAAQWAQWKQGKNQLEGVDRFFRKLAAPAGQGATLTAAGVLIAASVWGSRTKPYELPPNVAPVAALQAVREAGISGPVLNSYGKGGYLIFSGIPAFIDGRADMYREAFLRQYAAAMELQETGALEKVLDKYQITWTLLDAGTPAVALLDRLAGWHRVYGDKTTVVHAKRAE